MTCFPVIVVIMEKSQAQEGHYTAKDHWQAMTPAAKQKAIRLASIKNPLKPVTNFPPEYQAWVDEQLSELIKNRSE
jgi:hypothetical protein